MCHLSKKDQYVCQINQGIAEAVTCLLGGAQFSSCPFYHPRSSRGRFGHPREAAVCAGNFPDASGISDYFKRQKCSHKTEPVPATEAHLEGGQKLVQLGQRGWTGVYIHGYPPFLSKNWLRVFGHAEASRMGSGVGQQRYTRAVRSAKWRDSVAA